jgi:Zn-dependent oligopeptidase
MFVSLDIPYTVYLRIKITPVFLEQQLPRDFVEFPSQINEHAALDPEVLKKLCYSLPNKTGVIPQELIDKIKADTFQQRI